MFSTRLGTWITSLKGPVAFRKPRSAKNESQFQLLDLTLSFILKSATIHISKVCNITITGVSKSQRLQIPATNLKMESQYQDDLPVEWFEFTFSLPSELEMQMQDDYGDQGHIQQGYDMMATDYLQSPPTQEPQCAIATEGFINNFDLVHNFLPQDLGLFSTGLENYPMEPPNLESISPGVSTVTDWTLPSSSSSSDGYDGSANSPGLFTNALYGLPMTNMPVITSQSLVVAPVLLDNNITMTSNTGVGPQTLLEQQPYEQPSHVVTRASSQQLAGMSLPPETPSSSQPGIHRPPKKKTKRPTISE